MKLMNTGMKTYLLTATYWGTVDHKTFPTKDMAAAYLDWLIREDHRELSTLSDPEDENGNKLSKCIDEDLPFQYDDDYYSIEEQNMKVIVKE